MHYYHEFNKDKYLLDRSYSRSSSYKEMFIDFRDSVFSYPVKDFLHEKGVVFVCDAHSMPIFLNSLPRIKDLSGSLPIELWYLSNSRIYTFNIKSVRSLSINSVFEESALSIRDTYERLWWKVIRSSGVSLVNASEKLIFNYFSNLNSKTLLYYALLFSNFREVFYININKLDVIGKEDFASFFSSAFYSELGCVFGGNSLGVINDRLLSLLDIRSTELDICSTESIKSTFLSYAVINKYIHWDVLQLVMHLYEFLDYYTMIEKDYNCFLLLSFLAKKRKYHLDLIG